MKEQNKKHTEIELTSEELLNIRAGGPTGNPEDEDLLSGTPGASGNP